MTIADELIARAICDGFTNGNQQLDEVSAYQRDRFMEAARSVKAALRPTPAPDVVEDQRLIDRLERSRIYAAENPRERVGVHLSASEIQQINFALAALSQSHDAAGLVEWSFDDLHIGVKSGSVLKTREIPRPPRLSNGEWYDYANIVIAALRKLGGQP